MDLKDLIKELKKIWRSFWCFVILMKMGYYLSEKTNRHNKNLWGFLSLNFERGEVNERAIIDIDFAERPCFFFSDINTEIGNKTIFRVESGPAIKVHSHKQSEYIYGSKTLD